MWLLIVFILVWAFAPGPLTVVTLYETRKRGLGEGVAISAGAGLTCALMVAGALLIHAAGFSRLVETSGMKMLEPIGALGIIGMGIYAFYKSFGLQPVEIELSTNRQVGFFKGALTMAAYIPQALIFYALIVPKTVEPQMLIPVIIGLGILKTVLIFGWHSVIAVLTTRAQSWISNHGFGTLLERSTACLIIALGVRVLV